MANQFAKQLGSYNWFVGSIKIQFHLLARCTKSDCLNIYVDILGEGIK
jgi:hypothetical protein